jgi:hypothetical protein
VLCADEGAGNIFPRFNLFDISGAPIVDYYKFLFFIFIFADAMLPQVSYARIDFISQYVSVFVVSAIDFFQNLLDYIWDGDFFILFLLF